MIDSTSDIPAAQETQRSGEVAASAAEEVQPGGEEERTVPLEQLQASVEDGQEMTGGVPERHGQQQTGLGIEEPLLEEQTAHDAADQNAQVGDHVSELVSVPTSDTDRPTTPKTTSATSASTPAAEQASIVLEPPSVEAPIPPLTTTTTAVPTTQETDEAPPSLIPLEHARQPYSSQPSNARYGPASSSGGTGGTNGTAARGMPMLSGRPPMIESDTCRACGKYFIPLIRKRHNCNHCGYSYCGDDCSGYALMPRHGLRAGGGGSGFGNSGSGGGGVGTSGGKEGSTVLGAGRNGEGGYEMVEVCTYCTPMLQVTSGHPPFLRGLPLKRLQAYTKAYGLDTRGAIEKEDFVQTIVKSRSAVTGCLSPEAESYYRRRSVPKQGVLPSPPQVQTPRPRPAPQTQTQTGQGQGFRPSQAYRPGQGVPPRAPSSSAFPRASPGGMGYRPPPRPTTTGNNPPMRGTPPPPVARSSGTTPPGRSTPAATPPRRAPSPPVPSILSLVALPQSYLSSLSIGTLKAILYENHVKVDFSQVLEKTELVGRVAMLVAEERRRLERQRAAEEAEERAEAGVGRVSLDAAATAGRSSPQANEKDATGTATPLIPEIPTGPKASVERDGLCVVCQDQEAVFANIDCGHLCMCADCSKLVLATTRECPMCRTRIVTEQRLIRIFRT